MKIVNAEKNFVAPLIEECTETVEEVKLANIIFAENKNESIYKCIPCTVYIVLLSVLFTINVGRIVTYYVYYHWYLKKVFARETTIY